MPLVNPPGSALEFLGIVGYQSDESYKSLARKIAISTVCFFVVGGLLGSYILEFFGISLEILQVGGGIVVAAMGWSLLNQQGSTKVEQSDDLKITSSQKKNISWESGVFYPLTFPVTAGPGGLAVMLTLSAQARGGSISDRLLAYAGLMLAVVILGILVYVCYAYAPKIAKRISPSTVRGILRIIAFILLCIGVQIAWNGLQHLLIGVLTSVAHR